MADKKINDASFTGGTITDTRLLFTGDPSTGALKNIPGADLKTYIGAPLVYAVIVSQSGTAAPANDFEAANTTGLTFTWARTTNGTYTLTASGAFFTGLTVVTLTPSIAAFGYTLAYAFTSSTVLTVYARSDAGTLSDSALDHATVKLEQYL